MVGMEIGKLRSVALLREAGKMDLAELSILVNLRINSPDLAVSDAELAFELRRVGRDAARELWEFLNELPGKAGAQDHFHFATGLKEPSMASPGSTAHAAAIRWSEILSEAIELVGYDFAATPFPEARATYARMEKLLSAETDGLIAARLRFFQVGKPGDAEEEADDLLDYAGREV